MATNIPAARRILNEARNEALSREVVDRLISDALSLMTRSRHKRVTAPAEGRRITPELSRAIWGAYQRDPSRSVLDIAKEFDVNPGRVSEIIARRTS